MDGIKNLQLSNSNLEISHIYLFEEGRFVPYESYVQFVAGNSITYPFEDGQDYYLIIVNNGANTVNNAVLQMGEIPSYVPEDEITLSKGVKAFSLINTYGKDTSLQIVIPIEEEDNVFSVYNMDGKSIADMSTYSDDNNGRYIKYSFTLSVGEECYIFCSLVKQLRLVVLPNSNFIVWEIISVDDTLYTQDKISLERGESYQIRLLYDNDVYTFELETDYDWDSTSKNYNFYPDTGILEIDQDASYEYTIHIIPVKYAYSTLRINPDPGRRDIDYEVTFNKMGGTGGSDNVMANYERKMPSATVPSRTGYTFMGYYSEQNGRGHNTMTLI